MVGCAIHAFRNRPIKFSGNSVRTVTIAFAYEQPYRVVLWNGQLTSILLPGSVICVWIVCV